MKRRDLVRRLKAAGYKSIRNNDHEAYYKDGCRLITVPNHRELNEYTAKAILKEAGLI